MQFDNIMGGDEETDGGGECITVNWTVKGNPCKFGKSYRHPTTCECILASECCAEGIVLEEQGDG